MVVYVLLFSFLIYVCAQLFIRLMASSGYFVTLFLFTHFSLSSVTFEPWGVCVDACGQLSPVPSRLVRRGKGRTGRGGGGEDQR